MKGALTFVLIVVGGLILMDPFGSPNFTTLLIIVGCVAIVGLVVLFATGGKVQIGGRGNRIGDNYYTINETGGDREVGDWVNGGKQ